MVDRSSKSKEPGVRNGLNPWVMLIITAPIPLLLFVLFVYKWYQQSGDFERIKGKFVQRQNKVLAYEAISISRRINSLLEQSVRDVKALALVPPAPKNYMKFYLSHTAKITEYDQSEDRVRTQAYPIYNEISFLSLKGEEILRLSAGKITQKARNLSSCKNIDLCDQKLWENALKLPVGEILFGDLMRYYSPNGEPEIEEGATLQVAYRADNGVQILGIDYRSMKEILYLPQFPYQPKTNLYQAYLDGNYIYYVDENAQFIAHPKYWHVTGIDKKTGQRVQPVTEDADLGKRPLSVSAYRGDKLKDYFNRLLNVSFAQRSVDIFEAPNLTGTIRVLSVSPILFDKGQFKKTGVFGHVLTGCNVDFFTEPKERYLPYY
ncbi:MAG: hypothetical protein KDD39_01035 [Bdellovibrionales bacterium]|nr:hypothetical protein [Bdellovibrionales bacterium]